MFCPSLSVDPVNPAPTTSTRVFYISVGVCCAVIFLVAIILAVLHLHSMKRIELDDRQVPGCLFRYAFMTLYIIHLHKKACIHGKNHSFEAEK